MELFADFFAALRRMKAARTAPATTPSPASPPPPVSPAPQQGWRIGPAGMALIKQFEGCARRLPDGRFAAYTDPGTGAEPWTIGWGATGKGIQRGTIWTQAECDARLERDLARYAAEVARATLTKLHKAGDFKGAEAEFGKWVHAGGKRLNGLARRRAAEAALYKNGR